MENFMLSEKDLNEMDQNYKGEAYENSLTFVDKYNVLHFPEVKVLDIEDYYGAETDIILEGDFFQMEAS